MLTKLLPEFLADFTTNIFVVFLAFHFSFKVLMRGSAFSFALSLCSTMEQLVFVCGFSVWILFPSPELVALCMW